MQLIAAFPGNRTSNCPTSIARDRADHAYRILRIIFFYPVLAAISIGSIALNNSALYLQPWGDIYEAFALANFFLMVSTFISDDFGYHEQYFDTCPLRNGKVAGASWFRVKLGILSQTALSD